MASSASPQQNHSYPIMLRMNNTLEFISLALAKWLRNMQYTFIEHFNRAFCTEILDFYLFRTLNKVCEVADNGCQNKRRLFTTEQ